MPNYRVTRTQYVIERFTKVFEADSEEEAEDLAGPELFGPAGCGPENGWAVTEEGFGGSNETQVKKVRSPCTSHPTPSASAV